MTQGLLFGQAINSADLAWRDNVLRMMNVISAKRGEQKSTELPDQKVLRRLGSRLRLWSQRLAERHVSLRPLEMRLLDPEIHRALRDVVEIIGGRWSLLDQRIAADLVTSLSQFPADAFRFPG